MNYSPFRHIGSIVSKSRPIQLTFFLTSRCNARCRFCFYLSRNNTKEGKGELSLDEITRISSSLGPLLWLAFSGGEIFLRDDLVQITEIFYKKNRPAIILLPTNGLLPELITEQTETILNQCTKSTIVVKLSLDGTETVHDAIRGVKGSFRKTLETYERLRVLSERYPNFELGINSVFTAANQDCMDELIGFVNTLRGIRTHTISLIRGKVSDHSLKDIDREKYLHTIKLLEKNLRNGLSGTYQFRGARLKAAQDILQRRLIYKTLLEKKPLIPCYAGRLTLVITEDGEVYPCESFRHCMGNVREMGYDIERILHSSTARTVIETIRNEQCYCTHECYMMINILFNPLMYPSLIREYLQL
ncbi:MAG: radical SAM protein [Nitrospirae bacterium]|nr:radical SAM protein [Nitrospirota bacterium]